MNFKNSVDDIGFKTHMESCEFPATGFNHRMHLRLAYIYLVDNDTERSSELMRDTLNRFLLHNGVDPLKYHVTMTKAWIMAVHHFMKKSGNSGSAEELIDRYPEMLDTKIMMTHYSAEVLFSDEARVSFVEPDLNPIPKHEK